MIQKISKKKKINSGFGQNGKTAGKCKMKILHSEEKNCNHGKMSEK